MTAFAELIDAMVQGRAWKQDGPNDAARALMGRVYDERYQSYAWQKSKYQVRANLQVDD